MIEVSQQRFASAYHNGALVVDVRQPDEYVNGHVPGARLIPLSELPARIAEVPRDSEVYVICASGNRSKTAVTLLRRAGVDAYSVVGGTAQWRGAGQPVHTGPRP